MKNIIVVFFLTIILVGCKDKKEEEMLAIGCVKKAKDFFDLASKNQDEKALDFFETHDVEDPTSELNRRHYDSLYRVIIPLVSKYGIKPVKDWYFLRDTLNSIKKRYQFVFEDVLIEFNTPPKSDFDPTYILIGMEMQGGSGKFCDFKLFTKKETLPHMERERFIHDIDRAHMGILFEEIN